MIKKQSLAFITTGIIVLLNACSQKPKTEIRDDFKKHYDVFNVQGAFVLYNQSNDKYTIYNEALFKKEFSPASTFKICNSLIGLETGIIKDENFIIPWDSTVRSYAKWNTDNNLKQAFKNSTVWYYQELARRVGKEKMNLWLNKAQYGNMDTSGGIDKFWLTGGLRITPQQQIDFLKRLHNYELPFSKRAVDIVKNIMIQKDTLDYTIRAKTGWIDGVNSNAGWYVGYVEKNNNVYYFANYVECADTQNQAFGKARIEIAYRILNELKLISQ